MLLFILTADWLKKKTNKTRIMLSVVHWDTVCTDSDHTPIKGDVLINTLTVTDFKLTASSDLLPLFSLYCVNYRKKTENKKIKRLLI